MRESQTDPKAPGLVASAVALGVAAGASGEAEPLGCEHEQIVTRARQAWRIDMGGTVDGANTRDPVGYGVYGQAWEPNRHVLMENVGDDEVVNPWVLVDGRRDWRSVDHILSGILEPEMTEAQKARAIWEFARRRRYHSTPGTDEVKDTVKMLNVYGYTLCWDAAYTMSNLWQRAGLKIRRGLPHGHCTTEVFYDGAYHLLDSDEHLLVLMRDNRTVAGEAEISRDHDLMKRSHAYGILRRRGPRDERVLRRPVLLPRAAFGRPALDRRPPHGDHPAAGRGAPLGVGGPGPLPRTLGQARRRGWPTAACTTGRASTPPSGGGRRRRRTWRAAKAG